MMVTDETRLGPFETWLAFKLGAKMPFPYPRIVLPPVPTAA